MAYRRSDRLLAVAKFILKEKVGSQFWVDGPDGRRVPLELSLLLTLKHTNIVSSMLTKILHLSGIAFSRHSYPLVSVPIDVTPIYVTWHRRDVVTTTFLLPVCH